MKAVRSTAVVAGLILVTINVVAGLSGLPLRVLNVACVLAFAFFTCALSPKSPLGFALTNRHWGDIYRRDVQGVDVPVAADYRRAAARSLAILSTFVLLGFGMELVRRGVDTFSTDMAVLAGMEGGFVVGYLWAARSRSFASRHRESK